jgi:osmoprotectant transport system ATP-binding protein
VSAVAFDGVGVTAPGGRPILDGFSLEVAVGETVALVGPSGGGKTTALKLVNALRRPTAGTVRVDGRATTEWDPIALRRRTGWVIRLTAIVAFSSTRPRVQTASAKPV